MGSNYVKDDKLSQGVFSIKSKMLLESSTMRIGLVASSLRLDIRETSRKSLHSTLISCE